MRPSKRAFDLLASTVGIIVLSPVLAAIAVAIKTNDGGPILFRQNRVGRDGRIFRMLKFRTMVVDAERRGLLLTVGNDARVTPIGRLLRSSKLDELPQLINVIRGEMSLVGPRPEVPRYVALYTPEQRRVLTLVPGVTDPASIAYLDEATILGRAADPERAYIEEIMPRKLEINLSYAATATLRRDIALILRTLGVIAAPRGSVAT